MDAKTLASVGVSVSVFPVAFLLYRAIALFWNRNTYLEAWGNSPQDAEANVIEKLKDRAVID